MWLGVRDVFSPLKCKCGADVCLLQPRRPVPLDTAGLLLCFGTEGGSSHSLCQGSQQTVAWHPLPQHICFAVSLLEETDVKGVHLADGSDRSPKDMTIQEQRNVIPHLRREFCNELANLTVSVTQVTQFGKCREHLFWEQEVHLMKMAGLFCISYTLIIPILIFKKVLSKSFRLTLPDRKLWYVQYLNDENIGRFFQWLTNGEDLFKSK